MTIANRWLGVVILFFVALLISLLAAMVNGWARDLGQWKDNDPEISEWYRSLMQPDNPPASCCGEADAYWCDEIHVRDGRTYCNITDDRPDEPRKRPHVAMGTEIFIPDYKLKWDRGNPTGHSIVFLATARVSETNESKNQHLVYCFVQNGGV